MTGRIWMAEVELATSLAPIAVSRPPSLDDEMARVLVRLHGRPLGIVDFALISKVFDPRTVARAVAMHLEEPLRTHLDADGIRLDSALPLDGLDSWGPCAHTVDAQEPMSVVVCTRNHADALARCLRALQRLTYASFEVIVVDNAPDDGGTRASFERVVGRDDRFRYVLEPVPGLSRARNRGLQRAAARYVAFTDDDVRVDASWLGALAGAFLRHPDAGCVTGIVPPASLDHAAQKYFDRRYTWAAEMRERVFDLGPHRDVSALYPYSAGVFGTGANFAIDRELFQALGGFDEALGAGTPSGGGEDLDAFVRVLLAGRSIVYEPAAIGWHDHRCDARALRRQLFSYGCGLTAFLTKHLATSRSRREILRRIGPGLTRLRDAWNTSRIGGRAPPIHVLAELLGMGAGPVAYLRGRRRCTRARGASGGATPPSVREPRRRRLASIRRATGS